MREAGLAEMAVLDEDARGAGQIRTADTVGLIRDADFGPETRFDSTG